jgi:hypothetical protein
MLVGQQVLRWWACRTVAPPAEFQAVALAVVFAKDTGQSPEGDAKGAQEQRILDVIRPASHIPSLRARWSGDRDPSPLALSCAIAAYRR